MCFDYYLRAPVKMCIRRRAHYASKYLMQFKTPPIHPCKSAQLMTANSLILPTSASGMFTLLPIAQRSIDKLSRLIASELHAIGAQRLSCPLIADKSQWTASQRWSTMHADMFTFSDRHQQECCLQPTAEEAVTAVVASFGDISYAHLPLMLYQTGEKFRDEMRPTNGLLRTRAFLMNDLYSFDRTADDAMKTYEMVTDVYKRIFDERLRLPTMRSLAASGNFGGTLSHEFHLTNACGQDTIRHCAQCNSYTNVEVASITADCPQCHHHHESDTIALKQTVEIAHTFVLGTRFAQIFGANSASATPLHMCCFGIGVSRLLAAAIDTLSPNDREMRLPTAIAPFRLVVIVPKRGSKEDLRIGAEFITTIIDSIVDQFDDGDVLVDDRVLTIGHRLNDAQRIGAPSIVVIGRATAESIDRRPMFELYRCVPNVVGVQDRCMCTHEELIEILRERMVDDC